MRLQLLATEDELCVRRRRDLDEASMRLLLLGAEDASCVVRAGLRALASMRLPLLAAEDCSARTSMILTLRQAVCEAPVASLDVTMIVAALSTPSGRKIYSVFKDLRDFSSGAGADPAAGTLDVSACRTRRAATLDDHNTALRWYVGTSDKRDRASASAIDRPNVDKENLVLDVVDGFV